MNGPNALQVLNKANSSVAMVASRIGTTIAYGAFRNLMVISSSESCIGGMSKGRWAVIDAVQSDVGANLLD